MNLRRSIHWERGYAYFQEFIPANDHDTRVTVIGDRAFAFRRMVRPGDFRASGSGSIDYDPGAIDQECIRTAFEAARKIGTTCIAFDFVRRPSDGVQLIIEMSFAFKSEAVFACPGHWDARGEWRKGQMWPEDAILDDMLGQTAK
jgi:glutathione synthase/RimK-type ligase-like ATP-grasp enzyme